MARNTTAAGRQHLSPRGDRFVVRLDELYRQYRGGNDSGVCLSRRQLAQQLQCTPRTIARIEAEFFRRVRAQFAEIGCESLDQITFE